jgi:hypothetical protein
MHTALKKINARVKQLAKKHPGKKRVVLQRQAGAEYRAGKLGGSVGIKRKRKPVHKKKSVHRKRTVRTGQTVKVRHVLAGTVSHHLSAARHKLKEQIGWGEAQKFAATTKMAKRKIGKHIARLKHQYRKTL